MTWYLMVASTVVILALVPIGGAILAGRKNGRRVLVVRGAGSILAGHCLQEWSQVHNEQPVEDPGLHLPPVILADSAGQASGGHHRTHSAGGGAAAAAADSGIAAAQAWLSVDPAVFKAAAQAAQVPIDNLFDLASVAHLDSWANASADLRSALAGHTGEFIAANHLEAAGITTDMAKSASQPGWDATIGQLHVNFKDYADLHGSGIAEHFAKNPDVPIVVPSDAAHLPPDALNIAPGDHLDPSDLAGHQVLVLQGWEHGDATDAMQAAYNQLDPSIALNNAGDLLAAGDVGDAANALDIGFPFITALMSGYREGKLLHDGSTDVARAAKNFGLDVVGVAGGGGVGNYVGGGIGLALAGPPGALVGSILGGLVGAIGGRMLSGSIRHQPLHKAESDFMEATTEYVEETKRLDQRATQEWEATAASVKDDYEASLGELRVRYDSYTSDWQKEAEAASNLTAAAAGDALQRARLAPDTGPVANHTADKWMTRPGIKLVSHAAAAHQLHRDLARWDRECADVLNHWAGPGSLDEVLDLLVCFPQGRTDVEQFAADGASTRARAYRSVRLASADMRGLTVELRESAQTRLQERWEALQQEIAELLSGPQGKLAAVADRLERERMAAGGHASTP